MIDFTQFTNEQLWAIHRSANRFEWDRLLGEKPKGFDNLPAYHVKGKFQLRRKRTKEDYTLPVYWITLDLMPWGFYKKRMEEISKKSMKSLPSDERMGIILQGLYARGIKKKHLKVFTDHIYQT